MADDPVRLTITSNEPEAELVCGLLRNADIRCMHRITDMAFGAGGETASSGAGPREVLVRPADLAAARTILADRIAFSATLDDDDLRDAPD